MIGGRAMEPMDQNRQAKFKASLANRRVAVVEDRFFAALELTTTLESVSCGVIGPISSESRARRMLETERPDLVLLDIDLHGISSFDLARHLAEQGIPVIFVTGSGQYFASPEDLAAIPRLQKPVDREELLEVVARQLGDHPQSQSH